jgi:hypothetical protein
MDFATLPELADLNEQLPYPNTIAEAYWLAEVACMCHRRLQASHEAPDAKRLHRFLREASDGVSNAANDLHVLAEPAPAQHLELGWPVCVETVEAFNSIAETVALEYPGEPALIAELQALVTQWQQKLSAATGEAG